MLLIMGVTLYTSRITLEVLGVEDYGLYNVVGGIVGMLAFLNSSMAISVQRFLSYEIGKNNSKGLMRLFNTSIISHIIIALVIILLMETFGLWFLKEKLIIPLGRETAAMWVFQCAVATTAFSIIQVPYNAMLMAKEKMDIYAYVSIIDVILKLLIIYLLLKINSDKLIIYGLLLAIQSVLMIIINWWYCVWKFPEAKFSFIWDKHEFTKLTSFAGWSLMGELAWTFTGQGISIVLNQFTGAAVVAARGLAEQVNGAVNRFVQGFQTAANPQIVKLYASGNIDEMKILLFRVTRFSYYVLLFLSLPLIFEIDYILNIWLTVIPEHTTFFCQLILINSLTMTLSNPLSQVARAYGKIRKYQMWVSFFLFLNFPFSYLALCLGFAPESVMIVYFMISILLIVVRLLLCSPMINLSISKYIQSIICRVLLVTVLSSLLPLIITNSLNPSLLRITITSVSSILGIALFAYLFGLPVEDQLVVKNIVSKILNKK